MCLQTLSTPNGNVELIKPPRELVRLFSRRWPMGILDADYEGEPAFGIVFQRGERETWGVKLQQLEYSEEEARLWMEANSARLAMAIPGYLKAGFGGTVIAGVYSRQKDTDLFEPGIALFPVPDIDGKECAIPPELAQTDEQLGAGSGNMILEMLVAIGKVPEDALPPFQYIGVKLRPRLKMGTLRLDFLIHQQHVACLRTLIMESNPLWGYAAQAGLNQLLHMPSFCAGLPPD